MSNNSELIIVKSRISLKPTEEGGRISGFKSGYRPNHVFEMPMLTTYIGDIIFEGEELIAPGETIEVTVRFLKTPEIEKYINVGQKWFINEGSRTVGFGEILEIKS